MAFFLSRYMAWLHTGWPAGTVEKLPVVDEHGLTNIAGVRVVGDLTGVPLLKFSSDTGARALQALLEEPDYQPSRDANDQVFDVAIIGAGVAGVSAAIEATKAGLHYVLYEAAELFSTVVNFPKAKPIYTYPTEMVPAGIQFSAEVKEPLLEEMRRQADHAGVTVTQGRIERLSKRGKAIALHHADSEETVFLARRVIVAIGRSGNFRKLDVPGEERTHKVFNRLHDPNEFAGKQVLVVGGGDSALEAAIALACVGGHVTLSYRKPTFSRPKSGNVERLMALVADPAVETGVEHPSSERVTTAASSSMRHGRPPGSLTLKLGTTLTSIDEQAVTLASKDSEPQTLPNDVVFTMLGRAAPLPFFRRSGLAIHGEWSLRSIAFLVGFFAFCVWLYHWKSWPFNWTLAQINPRAWVTAIFGQLNDKSSLLYTLSDSMAKPSFYYTLAYCLCVLIFGIRRIRRRKTPYVTAQTLTLITIQLLPLFLLPEIILPWMGRNGFFQDGATLSGFADLFFEKYDAIGVERAYWRSYGFILAWPLMVYNWFTAQPMWGWLILGSIQTFVLIPLLVWRWGKGAYCGWLCSCGALAETLGDQHRQKMPHGPLWNRLNMLGQGVLWFALVLMLLRILGWIWPSSFAALWFAKLFGGVGSKYLSYKWIVDIALAGILGVGLYFHFSGRIWCRFACPLAALMHIYARFSRFRIFADKKKCISCNVCTSVCHQGIDVMNFANKGLPMEDPECVRCSACVQSCPTGTLSFGAIGGGGQVIPDKLQASPVRMRESRQLPVKP